MISRFIQYPNAGKIEVRSFDADELETAFIEGRVDIGISNQRTLAKNCTSFKIANLPLKYFVHRSVADLPIEELLTKVRVGFLVSGNARKKFRNDLVDRFPNVHLRFFISEFPSLIVDACRAGEVMLVVATNENIDSTGELVEISPAALKDFSHETSLYVCVANRLMSSSLFSSINLIIEEFTVAKNSIVEK